MGQNFADIVARFHEGVDAIRKEMKKVIVGQDAVIKQILSVVFARGHCLLVGVPGLAKTGMVRALGDLMDLKFKRIQFTPDLMPSDITGTNVLDETEARKREFRFVPGPVFANLILADEINRTPPKTQAALLEAMQERQVTVGQETHDLPRPFFVIATQNPIEQEGTYPLPEAQLDRFMFNVFVDYPSSGEEEEILIMTSKGMLPRLDKILDDSDILKYQNVIDKIAISDYLVSYVSRFVRASRPNDPTAPGFIKEYIDWGAGPRAGLYLILGAKAFAAMDGRFNVSLQDIQDVAVPVMRHRIVVNFQAQASGTDSVQITKRLMESVEKPAEKKYK